MPFWFCADVNFFQNIRSNSQYALHVNFCTKLSISLSLVRESRVLTSLTSGRRPLSQRETRGEDAKTHPPPLPCVQ